MPEPIEIPAPLPAEDAKLVTLAKATRARAGAAQGAALRDADGRTFAAASVELPSLRLSAAQVCVAMAIASGSRGVEALVVLADAEQPADEDLAVLADHAGPAGADRLVYLGDARGALSSAWTA